MSALEARAVAGEIAQREGEAVKAARDGFALLIRQQLFEDWASDETAVKDQFALLVDDCQTQPQRFVGGDKAQELAINDYAPENFHFRWFCRDLAFSLALSKLRLSLQFATGFHSPRRASAFATRQDGYCAICCSAARPNFL